MGTIGLGKSQVNGLSLVPDPPAIRTAFMVKNYLPVSTFSMQGVDAKSLSVYNTTTSIGIGERNGFENAFQSIVAKITHHRTVHTHADENRNG